MNHFLFIEETTGKRCVSKVCLLTKGDWTEETRAFEIPGSEIIVKLKPATNAFRPANHVAVRVVLVEPRDDVITLRSPASRLLSSDSRSLIVVQAPTSVSVFNTTLTAISFPIQASEGGWRSCFNDLTPSQEPDVTVVVDEHKIKTLKSILSSESDVFAAMFTLDMLEQETGVVEITDFSFEAVQEMIRFLMHGSCCRWLTHLDELTRIADKYNIQGMKRLANEKKELIDRLENS